MLDPTLTLVLITALVSALNPYTIGALILLSSVVYGRGHSSGRVFGLGLVYILTLITLSIAGGAGALYLFSTLPQIAATYLALGIGILIVCAGLLEIKDFFWYGQGIRMGAPKLAAQSIRSITKNHPGPGVAVALGLFVAAMSIPSGSAAYFATIALLRDSFNISSISLLVLYSILSTLPMLIMLLMVVSGVKVSTLLRWKEEAKGKMRLGVGLLLIALGWIIILTTSGVLNFGVTP